MRFCLKLLANSKYVMHIPKIPNIWGFFEFIFSKSHVLTFLCKKSLNTLVKRKKMCYNLVKVDI